MIGFDFVMQCGWRYGWMVVVVMQAACGPTALVPVVSGTTGASESSGGTEDGWSGSGIEPSNGTTTTSSTGVPGLSGDDDGPGPRLDLEEVARDLPAVDDVPTPTPSTCEAAEAGASTVGCQFYAVDMNSLDTAEFAQYGVVASNVQIDVPASVSLEMKFGGTWNLLETAEIRPLELHAFQPLDNHHEGTGLDVGGAFRVRSSVPIAAYQFNPLDGAASFSSDASMLYPVPTLDTLHVVVGMPALTEGNTATPAYVTIVGTRDDTTVVVTPTSSIEGGGGVPSMAAGSTGTFTLDEGDVLQLESNTGTLSGTRVESGDKPVAVFSGHECMIIPPSACDHLEEQMAGLHRWGRRFVAAHLPQIDVEDANVWQVLASEDDTVIELSADPEVIGVPPGSLVLGANELLEFTTRGPAHRPGDFLIDASKPIAVHSYMGHVGGLGGLGDPCMVAHAPVEQYLSRYVVLVPPGGWASDFLVIVRPTGSAIEVDGSVIPDGDFSPVGPDHEVARLPVADGIHVIEGDVAFEVIGAGFDVADSYCYLAGAGAEILNPAPQ